MAGAGSCDHEALDAQQYSNWTVVFHVVDGCGGCNGTAPDPHVDAKKRANTWIRHHVQRCTPRGHTAGNNSNKRNNVNRFSLQVMR